MKVSWTAIRWLRRFTLTLWLGWIPFGLVVIDHQERIASPAGLLAFSSYGVFLVLGLVYSLSALPVLWSDLLGAVNVTSPGAVGEHVRSLWQQDRQCYNPNFPPNAALLQPTGDLRICECYAFALI